MSGQEGDGWSPVKGERRGRVSRPGQEEQVFDEWRTEIGTLLLGEYRFSVGGARVVPQE